MYTYTFQSVCCDKIGQWYELFYFNFKVEFKVFSPTDHTDFPSDAFLHISSNVEQILNLSRSGKIKHFYLLYETPNECKKQNKIMYDGSNRDKIIVLYEQEFDKKKLSFFKEVSEKVLLIFFIVTLNLHSMTFFQLFSDWSFWNELQIHPWNVG